MKLYFETDTTHATYIVRHAALFLLPQSINIFLQNVRFSFSPFAALAVASCIHLVCTLAIYILLTRKLKL